jgi:hypothetical protein
MEPLPGAEESLVDVGRDTSGSAIHKQASTFRFGKYAMTIYKGLFFEKCIFSIL